MPFLPPSFHHNLRTQTTEIAAAVTTASSHLPTASFAVQIQEGNTTDGSTLGLIVPNGATDFIILPSTALLTYTVSPEILQQSSNSSLAASLALTGVSGGESDGTGLGADGGSVTVDTTPPEVDVTRGVEVSGSGDGTYTYGDTVFITVW